MQVCYLPCDSKPYLQKVVFVEALGLLLPRWM
jgi:hypothetical protein